MRGLLEGYKCGSRSSDAAQNTVYAQKGGSRCAPESVRAQCADRPSESWRLRDLYRAGGRRAEMLLGPILPGIESFCRAPTLGLASPIWGSFAASFCLHSAVGPYIYGANRLLTLVAAFWLQTRFRPGSLGLNALSGPARDRNVHSSNSKTLTP